MQCLLLLIVMFSFFCVISVCTAGLIVGVVVAVVVIIAGVIFVVSLILFRYRTKLLKCWCSEDGQVSAVSILRM